MNSLLPTGIPDRRYLEICADGNFRRAFSTSLAVSGHTHAERFPAGLYGLAPRCFSKQEDFLSASSNRLNASPGRATA